MCEKYPIEKEHQTSFNIKENDLFFNLLRSIAHSCGYKELNDHNLKNNAYHPHGYEDKEKDDLIIRKNLLKLLCNESWLDLRTAVVDYTMGRTEEETNLIESKSIKVEQV